MENLSFLLLPISINNARDHCFLWKLARVIIECVNSLLLNRNLLNLSNSNCYISYRRKTHTFGEGICRWNGKKIHILAWSEQQRHFFSNINTSTLSCSLAYYKIGCNFSGPVFCSPGIGNHSALEHCWSCLAILMQPAIEQFVLIALDSMCDLLAAYPSCTEFNPATRLLVFGSITFIHNSPRTPNVQHALQ